MRKIILNRILKRGVWGISFIVASYIIGYIGVLRFLMSLKFGIPTADFLYVLFVAFLPYIIQSIGYGILISIAFMLVKYSVMPTHRLEKSYMAIKKTGLRRALLIVGGVALLVLVIPYFFRDASATGMVLDSANDMLSQPFPGIIIFGEYFDLLAQTAVTIVQFIIRIAVLTPLSAFYGTRIDTLVASFFLAALFFHTAMVGVSMRSAKVSRETARHICQDGDSAKMTTEMTMPIPSPNVKLRSAKPKGSSIKKWKIKSDKNLLATEMKNSEEFSMSEGYYNFDIVPIRISTIPFFRTTVYKVCDQNADISVVPKIKYKSRIISRRPIITKETGSLVRKQLGQSMDFAGLREYSYGDPLSRIWWKGLAKDGKMLVKEFHSFGEDRWILVFDFTNQNMKEEVSKNMYRFGRLFIELCTRKDISVGISSFSPNFHYSDYSNKKKDLLSSLTMMNSPNHEISPKGTELILKDALGSDLKKLKRKCKSKRITLPTVYSFSGLGKKTTMLSWKGKKAFDNSMKSFFVNMKKSGKVILLTDSGKDKIESLKRFKAICENRHCIHMVILLDGNTEMQELLKNSRIKTLVVENTDIATPSFVANVVRMV